MANEAGLVGSLDFVGYPTGQTQPAAIPNVPTAGFYGFLDFVGYPVGGGAKQRVGATFGYGKRQLASMMYRGSAEYREFMAAERRRQFAARSRQLLRHRAMQFTLEEIREQRSVNAAVGAAFLSEI